LVEWSVVTMTYLTTGCLFSLVDFGLCRPKWLRKIQDVTAPTDEYLEILSVGLRNLALNLMLIPFYTFWKDTTGYSTSPPGSWLEIVLDFVKFILPFSVWFYLWHRLVHINPLYGWIHKKHHKYKTPVAFEGLYFSVIDMFMGNIFPIFFCSLLAVRSQWTVLLIYVAAMANACATHSGYNIPFIDLESHDAHHEFFNVNYGSGGIWMDLLFGTYLSSEDIQKLRKARKRRVSKAA